jgi:hypothetical protein
MRRTEQINAFWELTRERSVDGGVVRRRVAAICAIAIVFCGFLLAIGLGVVVLAFLAGALASVGVVALVAIWPRLQTTGAASIGHVGEHGHRLSAILGPRFRQLGAASARAVGTGRTHTSRVARRASASGSRIGRELGQVGRTHASAVARTALASGSRLGESAGQSARATALRFAPRAARLDPQREAIRLNAAGTQHRRSGRHDDAVACHRQALEILRALGDRRGVALTQSNLALALSHAGDDEWAIGLFEEAAATLRDLGEDEHEGQVMANLGLVHRRHGRRQEGDNVLELALAKLNPASSAYQAVEAELRRAS